MCALLHTLTYKYLETFKSPQKVIYLNSDQEGAFWSYGLCIEKDLHTLPMYVYLFL